MNFPSEPVHTTSPVQTETITVHMIATQAGNPVSVPDFFTTAVASVAVDNAEFAVTGGTCTTGPTNVGLNDGSTCTIDLTFTPAALGTRVANLLVSCAVAEAAGELVITCNPVAPPPELKAGPLPHDFIVLQGLGLGAVGAALNVPMLGNGALTLLALLLFAASMVAMRRKG